MMADAQAMTIPEQAVQAAPCPRCASANVYIEPDERGSGSQWVFPVHIGCNDCGINLTCHEADTVEDAVSHWNERRALTAALPFLPVQGAVKKLEWRKGRAETPFGPYHVIEETNDDEPFWFVMFNGKAAARCGTHDDEESAIFAAQADYEARILSALEPSAAAIELSGISGQLKSGTDMGNPITLVYTNYRGETSERTITPIRPWFGSTEWHPEPQWLLKAYDHEKGAERDFAFKDFGRPEPSAGRAAVLEEALRKMVALYESEYDADVPFKRPDWLVSALHPVADKPSDDGAQVEGWLPIESAPKDGTPFLVFVPDDKFSDGTGIDVIWYDEEQWLFGSNTPFYPANAPTHWRPLPSAPSQEVAGS